MPKVSPRSVAQSFFAGQTQPLGSDGEVGPPHLIRSHLEAERVCTQLFFHTVFLQGKAQLILPGT